MGAQNVRFDTYYKYGELTDLLRGYAEAYPFLVDIEVMGRSWEGRDIFVLTLTNKKTGPAEKKPAMYVDGNMHAGEVTGSMVCLYMINYLLSLYGKDEEVTWLMDTGTLYIAPRVNPDGAEKYLTTPAMLRSSVRPYPDDQIPEQPGLHAHDIDGDGRILTMRVRDDVRGEWKVSVRDSRIMVPRRIDDRTGPFYRIYQEGYIKDYDGEPWGINPPPWGLDMNRNFPAHWNPNAKQGGPYPASEPEVKNIVDFILAHPNIGGLEAFHTTGGIIFRSPYAYPDEEMDRGDYETMIQMVRRGTEITGYPDVSSHGQSTATIVDWAYENGGIIGYCTELWDMAGRAGVAKRKDYSTKQEPTWDEMEEMNLKLLEWNDRELAGEGFVRWRKFDHPQLGEVEIGGWEPKFVRQNCPPKFLEQECHKNTRWAMARWAALPKVRVSQVDVKQVPGNDGGARVYAIRAVAENAGYLPTNISNKAVEIKVARTVKLKIDLPSGVTLLGGKRSVDVGHLEGYRQGQNANMWGPSAPARSSARAQWLVRADFAPATVKITVDGGRGGVHSREVELG